MSENQLAGAPPRVAVVVLAGGSGARLGGPTNKVLLPLAGIPVLAHSVRTALDLPGLHRLVIVVREADRAAVADAVTPFLGATDVWLVPGGTTRHDSETAALSALRRDVEAGDIDVVVLHDGARPLASPGLWQQVVSRAAETGGAVPVVTPAGLVSRETMRPVRSQVAVQTPQAFAARALLAAYDDAGRDAFAGTDTSACLEAYRPDVIVSVVPGEHRNLKITWPGDIATAQALTGRDGSPPPAP